MVSYYVSVDDRIAEIFGNKGITTPEVLKLQSMGENGSLRLSSNLMPFRDSPTNTGEKLITTPDEQSRAALAHERSKVIAELADAYKNLNPENEKQIESYLKNVSILRDLYILSADGKSAQEQAKHGKSADGQPNLALQFAEMLKQKIK